MSLQIAQIPELVGDLVEIRLCERLLGLLVLDDDAPEQEPDQITRRGEARPLDRVVDPVGEILRDGDRGVVCHGSWWRVGADKRRGHTPSAEWGHTTPAGESVPHVFLSAVP